MAKALPARPNLSWLRKSAKQHLRSLRSTDPKAKLAAAQLALARDYGFASWRKLKARVDSSSRDGKLVGDAASGLLEEFLDASVPRPNFDHRSGDTNRAEALLAREPGVAAASIYAACILGDAAAVAAHLRRDATLAMEPGGPRGWRPLSYLCFSRFLRLRRRPVEGFVRAAKLLLDRGADPNTSFFSEPDKPDSVVESALYGAAGVANEPALTKLLLDAGADVNDHSSESLYHASEFTDITCLRLILERGPKPEAVSYCLARKLDFEDIDGARLYLDHGADPNFRTPFGDRNTRLHHAVIRGRSAAIIDLLIDRGADVNARNGHGLTAYQLARRYGFTDVAELLLRRGAEPESDDRERFLAACAAGEARAARRLLRSDPHIVRSLGITEQRILPDAAASDHRRAVKLMLDLGFDIDTPGDWHGSALHQAAWQGHVALVRLLLKRGARIDTKNQYGGDALHTALHGAAHAGHDRGAEVVRIFLNAIRGAELTPYLTVAREHGNEAIVRLLESFHAKQQPRQSTRARSSSWKPLMDASLAGDVERARRLLDAGADPNAVSTTAHRYRPLHRAIEHKKTMPKHAGHDQVVQLLLKRGADPTLRGGFDQLTALGLAAVDEPRFVQILRPHFEPLDIFHAAALADERRVAELLRHDRSLASATDVNGWQPLHYCAGSRTFRHDPKLQDALARVAQMLIDAGADPMAYWKFNGEWPLRPLYYACGRANNHAVATVLLDAGADPCDGEAVYHASDEGHSACLALIEQRVPRRKLAREATMCLRNQLHWGRTRGMRWLLEHGADPNALDRDRGTSALHEAARAGLSEPVIALLLEHGADPRVKTRDGKTATEVARAARQARVARQLEAAGYRGRGVRKMRTRA